MAGPAEDGSRKIPLVFYRAASGAEPVLDWLKSLPKEERRDIGQDLMRAQWRWPVGMPCAGHSVVGSGKSAAA